MDPNPYLEVAPEVRGALDAGRPVVAFETSIVCFGLPSPLNAVVGAAGYPAARDEGAVPATAAILEGKVRVGLAAEDIAFFCTRDPAIRKVNPQNFAATLAAGAPGALTVAASLQACAMAGVRVFATGGIGGVHRGWAQLPDVSSDLRALATHRVATVCAGAKSILDIPATLEALETLGVPVAGFRTDTFPLFHSAASAFRLDIHFDEVEPLAAFARAHFTVGDGGVLVVTPVPGEEAIQPGLLEKWIATALDRAAGAGVTGRAVTPFLLACLEEISGGQTLRANRALILNNARTAARLAVALAKITP